MNKDLTEKEKVAFKAIVETALEGMGGSEPNDLLDDMYTWFTCQDIVERTNFNEHQASGLMSSLMEKGVVSPEDDPTRDDDMWFFGEDSIKLAQDLFY